MHFPVCEAGHEMCTKDQANTPRMSLYTRANAIRESLVFTSVKQNPFMTTTMAHFKTQLMKDEAVSLTDTYSITRGHSCPS